MFIFVPDFKKNNKILTIQVTSVQSSKIPTFAVMHFYSPYFFIHSHLINNKALIISRFVLSVKWCQTFSPSFCNNSFFGGWISFLFFFFAKPIYLITKLLLVFELDKNSTFSIIISHSDWYPSACRRTANSEGVCPSNSLE